MIGRWARRLELRRLALLGLMVASALVAVALWRAIDLEPVPAPATDEGLASARSAPVVRGVDPKRLVQAIDNDPFRPERTRPSQRFLLPNRPRPTSAPVEAPPPEPTLRLLGTVVLPNGRGLAMIDNGGERSRMVHVGESIGGMRLQAVERGQATFITSSGSERVIRVQKPGG